MFTLQAAIGVGLRFKDRLALRATRRAGGDLRAAFRAAGLLAVGADLGSAFTPVLTFFPPPCYNLPRCAILAIVGMTTAYISASTTAITSSKL